MQLNSAGTVVTVGRQNGFVVNTNPRVVCSDAEQPSGFIPSGLWCMFYAAVFLFWDLRTKSKCKPIYDRWVMQHGINPDKWPELPQAPARTTTAQSLGRTTSAQSLGRTTSAQSLGRSLGRSLGWLLFGHPILFWSLLIGAALAIIYSVSWKAEVTAPKMQLPTIPMETIHPFDL